MTSILDYRPSFRERLLAGTALSEFTPAQVPTVGEKLAVRFCGKALLERARQTIGQRLGPGRAIYYVKPGEG